MSKGPENKAAKLAGALSNPLRMAIVTKLAQGPCLAGELVDYVGAEQAVVSKQLGLLRACGLLLCQPQGRCRSYSLADPEAVNQLLEALAQVATKASLNAVKCKGPLAAQPEATQPDGDSIG